jgi:monoamine oxidase
VRPGLIGTIARRVGAASTESSRREFLNGTLASAGLLMAGRGARATGRQPRVVIVGAGFAGLSCGFQLRNAGAHVTLIEARDRVGGRVRSFRNFIDGRVVEGGGELIGSNHPMWMAYGKQFGLRFSDVTELEADKAPIILDGKRYSGKELVAVWEGLQAALENMVVDARTVNLEEPWKTPDAKRLDGTSVASMFASWKLDDTARQGALALLSNDHASWPDRESYLSAISTVAGGGYKRYWTESEVHRCIGGNQQLAFKLAEAIGSEYIQLDAPVSRIRLTSSGVAVQRADGGLVEGDLVVLTAPPPTWKHFEIEPVLPAGYQPFTGPAVKFLSKVSRPFWRRDGLQPISLTDTPVGETWESTDGQKVIGNQPSGITVFSGGKAAQACLDMAPGDRAARLGGFLNAIFPGYSSHVEKTMFMGWPEEKWTLCGYSTPTVGQVTTIYPNLAAGFRDRLFFAGEHTSLLFTGYMEGGLNSGARLAQKLAGKLGLSHD